MFVNPRVLIWCWKFMFVFLFVFVPDIKLTNLYKKIYYYYCLCVVLIIIPIYRKHSPLLNDWKWYERIEYNDSVLIWFYNVVNECCISGASRAAHTASLTVELWTLCSSRCGWSFSLMGSNKGRDGFLSILQSIIWRNGARYTHCAGYKCLFRNR